MNSRLIIIFILAAGLLAGCRSSKKVTESQPGETTVSTVPVKGDSFDRLTASYGQWSDVNVPVNIRISSPTKFSISGRANLVRGKSIDISLRVLGFEMGRAFITTDSVFVVVKPQRTYMAESLAEVTKYVSFTTENIQDLLIGRPFLLGRPTLSLSDKKLVEIETFESGMLIKPRKQPSMANYGYAADLEELLTKLVIVSAGSNTFKAEVSYSGHALNTPAGVVSSDADIQVATPKASYSATLTWKWNNAKWDSGNRPDFTVPQGYKRILAKDLLKSAMPK